MRRISLCVIAVLGLVLAASSASEASNRKSQSCSPRYSRLVVADAQAEVFLTTGEYPRYAGCTYARRKSYELGPPDVGGVPDSSADSYAYTLAGPIVAYAETETRGYVEASRIQSHHVVVRDLLTGQVLHDLPTGTPPAGAHDEGIGSAVAIVVKGDGAVAWIVQVLEHNAGAGLRSNYEVRALDKTGAHVLAISTEISPSSLKLVGGTLYWTQGGKSMSGKLE